MTDYIIPDSLPPWIKQHVELYLADGEAGHLWDSSAGGGEGMLTTLLLTTTGRKSGKLLKIPLIYRPVEGGGYFIAECWRPPTDIHGDSRYSGTWVRRPPDPRHYRQFADDDGGLS